MRLRRAFACRAEPSYQTVFYRIFIFEESLPALQGNHQNKITLSSGLIAGFALEWTCNTRTARRATEPPGRLNPPTKPGAPL
jgi:hypothetical protein